MKIIYILVYIVYIYIYLYLLYTYDRRIHVYILKTMDLEEIVVNNKIKKMLAGRKFPIHIYTQRKNELEKQKKL